MPPTAGRLLLLPTLIVLSIGIGPACSSQASTEPKETETPKAPYRPPPPIVRLDVVSTDALIFVGQSAPARDLILRAFDSSGAIVQNPTLDFKAPCHPFGPPCVWASDGVSVIAPSVEAQTAISFQAKGGLSGDGDRPISLSDLVGTRAGTVGAPRADDAGNTAANPAGPDSTGNPTVVRITAAIDLRTIPWLAHWTCTYDRGALQDGDGVSIDSIRFQAMRSGNIIYNGASWKPNDGALALVRWTGTELRFRADGRIDASDTTTFQYVAAQAPDTLFLAAGYGNSADTLHRDRWPAVLQQAEPRRYVGGNGCGPDASAPGTVTIEAAQ